MTHITKSVLLHSFLLLFSFITCGQNMKEHRKITLQIVNENNHLLNNCKQLLVVYNEKPEDHRAVLAVLEKKDKGWKHKLNPVHAEVGKKGFAESNKKIEGDGKSPTGLFTLGHLFSYEKAVKTKMPYSQTTEEDKWIDDPDSKDYNRYVRGETNAKSHENLKLQNDFYKYCMVINYNTNPAVKGKGSAIFFHLSEDPPGSTAGCVSIAEKNMLWILEWMNPELNPSILMGNKKELAAGLKK